MATALRLAGPEPHLRVLLVDDERDVRRMLQRSMARMGFETTEAGDGQAALELLRHQDFDLVVSDVQMPGMTGIELLGALDREGLDVPVVLVSGSLEVPDAGAARDLGAFDFFRKPFSLEELRKAARRAAVSRRASGRHSLRPSAVDSEA
jgi:two-component system response regulator AtoC